MSREEAINHVLYLSATVEGEFCVGDAERAEHTAETRECLLALGVSEAELP